MGAARVVSSAPWSVPLLGRSRLPTGQRIPGADGHLAPDHRHDLLLHTLDGDEFASLPSFGLVTPMSAKLCFVNG